MNPFDNLKKRLAELSKSSARVGWPASARYVTGESVAEVAVSNEFGRGNVPARPFIRAAMRDDSRKIETAVKYAVTDFINGGNVNDVYNEIGEAAVEAIIMQIKSGGFAPNAPATVKIKGFNKPLIDTGLMFQSLTSMVEKR